MGKRARHFIYMRLSLGCTIFLCLGGLIYTVPCLTDILKIIITHKYHQCIPNGDPDELEMVENFKALE